MSMNFSGKASADAATMRARDWPCLRQFGIFMENRVGTLHELLRHIERHDLRVMALTIVDSIDFSIARLILSNYERALELFRLSEFKFFETDLIGVELANDPQPFVRICLALLQAEINIHYTYPLLYRKNGRGAIALSVDEIETGIKTLREKGMQIVTENDLLEYDDSY
jgi:hypothetical protein